MTERTVAHVQLRGRSFVRLLRPTSRGTCGAALCGIRGASPPCGDARFFASRDPPLVACAGAALCGIRGASPPCGEACFFASCDPPLVACAGPLLAAFEARAPLAGSLVSLPPATHLSWHVRDRSVWHSRWRVLPGLDWVHTGATHNASPRLGSSGYARWLARRARSLRGRPVRLPSRHEG